MWTTIRLVALAGLALVSPLQALADALPSPNVYRSLDSGSARDAGAVSGTVEAVDYAGQVVTVRSRRRVVLIAIVPSTAIYRGRQFGTLSDLHRGESVEADVYMINGRLVARSINVRE